MSHMQAEYGAPHKTKSATFRMPDRVYGALVKEARRNRESVNTLVNQLLFAGLFDDLPRVRPMLVTVPTPIFAEILSRLSESDTIRVGKLAAEGVARSAMLGRYGQITVDHVVDTLRITAERGGYGTLSDVTEERRTITIRHELGYNGSLFFAVVAEDIFRMAGMKPEIEKTEEAVVIQL